MSRALVVIGGVLVLFACFAAVGTGVALWFVSQPTLPSGGNVAIADCDGYVAPLPRATATATAQATPSDPASGDGGGGFGDPERVAPIDAVRGLTWGQCRWDAAGVLVPVPAGWRVQVLGRISASRTSPGDLGAIRMNGVDSLEEFTVTFWARDQRPSNPDILYPNPWNTWAAMYERGLEDTGEVAFAGKRAARGVGEAARRDIELFTFFGDGKAWAYGGSSDVTGRDALAPLLEQMAIRTRPAPAATATPTPAK